MKYRKQPIKYIILASLVMAMVAFIGGHLLKSSHADTPRLSFEVENGNLAGGARIVTDGSASQQQAVRFGKSTSMPAGQEALVAQIRSLAADTQTALATRSSPSDTQYYQDGVWLRPGAICGPCDVGPGTEAAYLWHYGGMTDAVLKQRAIDTFNAAITTSMHADGSMGDGTKPDTQFFGNELADLYLQMEPGLDSSTKQSWQASLKKLTAYLVSNKNYTYYTNGNINLDQTLLAYKMWRVTGDQQYKDLYEQELAFTLNPPQERWKGFGLQYTKVPTKDDGSDGAGYLAENGGNGPGYDGDYTHFQLTIASELYVLSKDPRSLRLANLFANQLLQHIDDNWMLDATNGSRHSLKFGAFSSGFILLAWQGGRTDLLPRIQDQFTDQIKANYLGNAVQNWGSPGLYRGYGVDVAVLYALTYQ